MNQEARNSIRKKYSFLPTPLSSGGIERQRFELNFLNLLKLKRCSKDHTLHNAEQRCVWMNHTAEHFPDGLG
jgi:hypothetical protein